MKYITLKNYHFIGNMAEGRPSFHGWLGNQLLAGALSRSRSQFLRSIRERVEEIGTLTTEILKKHAKRSPEGLPLLKDFAGVETTEEKPGYNYQFTTEEEKLTNEELKAFTDKDFIIDVTPANASVIQDVKLILERTQDEFKAGLAVAYDEWCAAFESITEEAGSKKVKAK